MASIEHFPHIRNTQAGNRYYDPMHQSIFEVAFSIPTAIASKFNGQDVAILTEQVTNVAGLDALQKVPTAGNQKFFGVDVSFLNPVLDNTYAELQIDFNLNIRNSTDAYVLRIFKEWGKLGYDIATGSRRLMKDYIAPFLSVKEANRDGVIWRDAKFQKVILINMTGLDALDYINNEARKLSCTFRCDLWDENIGTGISQQ